MNKLNGKRDKVLAALAANTKVYAAWQSFVESYRAERGTDYGMTLKGYLGDFVKVGQHCGHKVIKISGVSPAHLWRDLDGTVRTEVRAYLSGEGFFNLGLDSAGLECWKEVA